MSKSQKKEILLERKDLNIFKVMTYNIPEVCSSGGCSHIHSGTNKCQQRQPQVLENMERTRVQPPKYCDPRCDNTIRPYNQLK